MRKLFFKLIPTLGLSFALTACTTIRMKYEGEFKTPDGKKGLVKAEKSYDMGNGDSTMCMITGIFLGGYCWYYSVMPTTQQRQTMEADVKEALKENLKTDNFELKTTKNDKLNWEKQEDNLNVEFLVKASLKDKKPAQ